VNYYQHGNDVKLLTISNKFNKDTTVLRPAEIELYAMGKYALQGHLRTPC